VVDTEGGIFIIGVDFLGDLPLVALVGSRDIISQRFRACEFVIG